MLYIAWLIVEPGMDRPCFSHIPPKEYARKPGSKVFRLELDLPDFVKEDGVIKAAPQLLPSEETPVVLHRAKVEPIWCRAFKDRLLHAYIAKEKVCNPNVRLGSPEYWRDLAPAHALFKRCTKCSVGVVEFIRRREGQKT